MACNRGYFYFTLLLFKTIIKPLIVVSTTPVLVTLIRRLTGCKIYNNNNNNNKFKLMCHRIISLQLFIAGKNETKGSL
jgi:hypothetical protein